MDFEKVKNPRNSSTQYFSICCWKNQKAKKAKNKISIVKKWKKVWKTEGHQFLYLMVCLTHVYMADIKHLLVLLDAQEGKHPCSKRLPFLRKWEAEGKRFLHQLYIPVCSSLFGSLHRVNQKPFMTLLFAITFSILGLFFININCPIIWSNKCTTTEHAENSSSKIGRRKDFDLRIGIFCDHFTSLNLWVWVAEHVTT